MKSFIKRLIKNVFLKLGFVLERNTYSFQKNLKAASFPGFFSEKECLGLYSLVSLTQGPILEIGHFLGKSTACICQALHESQKQRIFKSYDIGFASPEEFQDFYSGIYKKKYTCPKIFDEMIFSKNMTTTEITEENLKQCGLDGYVELITGDFIKLDQDKYEFIFCDALHDQQEIEVNLSSIIEHSNKGCIWAFHDMKDVNVDEVLAKSSAVLIERYESLGVFLFKG